MAPAMASQDTPMLSSSSSHRLPTISASQALQTLQTRGALAVSTGLAQLNKILSPRSLPGRDIHGGLPRGKVAEVYGPSGVGKTALGIQAAVNALREGQQVVWIDAGAPLVPQRFNDVLFADEQVQRSQNLGGTDASPPEVQLDELRSHFHHCTSPSLAHLLALFVRTPSSFPPPNTSLIVIDSLSTLLDNAYPRNPDDRAARPKNDQARWAAGRKFPVMNELISALCRIAALHDIALLLTCQTITRIRAGSRALLVPSISGAEWESGISTRLVLFRDWVPGQGKWCDADAERLRRARFVGVIKANGVTLTDEGSVGDVVPYAIERKGLLDLAVSTLDITTTATSPQQRLPKRRFAEIGDSEDDEPDSEELYGWVEDDEVAAEGLLIVNDTPVANDPADAASPAASRTDHVPEREKKRVAQFERTATV